MSTSLAYHTQGIVGFQHHSFQYSEGEVIQRLKRKEFRCPKCFHCSVNAHHYRTRRIQGLPYGGMKVYFEVELHRIYCPRCRALSVEELPFLSHPKARITKALERTIIELRPEMTIHAISNYFHLDWRIVKACEKRYLKRKFRRIKLKHVKIIGIDEIAIGHTAAGKTAYWTIVRDLDSGAVLHVDQGKDGDALRAFLLLLRRSKAEIEVVAMDMGKAFIHWVKEHLPSAQIVFDHFHVIKLMNEKLDLVRRRIAAKLDADERAILKNQRFTLLRNEENLSSEATAYLAKIKQTFQELADVHMMKEALRSIYSVAQNVSQAEDALLRWVKAAQKIQSDQLHKMAKTILQYWDGILGFWRFGNMTNASMEGFNNKVRTMLRQAYGYRDHEYMRLKIFNLPNNNLKIII